MARAVGALEVFAIGISNRVNNKIQLTPLFFHFVKNRFDLGIVTDVAGQDHFGIQTFSQRTNPLLQSFVEIGKSQSRTLLFKLLGNPPGNTHLIGYAENNTLFSCHQSHTTRFSCK